MKNIIKYTKFGIALSLFFFGTLLQYIPIFILKLDSNNLTINQSFYLTIFSNALCFTILVIMYRKSLVEGYKDLISKKGKPLLRGFEIWFIGLMIMVFSNVLISWLNGGNTSTNEESLRYTLKMFPILSSLSIAIFSPIIEELVFRKSFREIFHNKWIYLATSGLIFGALHVFLSPINSFVDYLFLIPYCSMGVAFCYMYYESDNIMVPISMHVMHNTINIISTLFLAGVIW